MPGRTRDDSLRFQKQGQHDAEQEAQRGTNHEPDKRNPNGQFGIFVLIHDAPPSFALHRSGVAPMASTAFSASASRL